MQIPPEIISPYRADSNKLLADNKKAEPVGESARLGGTRSGSARNQHAVSDQELSEIGAEKREPHENASREHHTGEECRREDRRKEAQTVMLDTRLPQSRRESGRLKTINFKI